MNKVIIVDNYDSFTFNLAQIVREIRDDEPLVMFNNQVDYDILNTADCIILSPGPGIPSEAGDLLAVIDAYAGKIPMLGVCLGHQAIAEYFGGKLLNMETVFHGKKMRIHTSGLYPSVLFKELPETFEVGRYHSWILEKEHLPSCLSVTAVDDNYEIMAIQHTTLPVFGVQFHPESIMTEYGKEMLVNFMSII